MTEPISIAGIEFVAAAVVAAATLLWVRISDYRRAFRKADPAGEYSPARYRPMARLFSGADSEFVAQYVNCPKIAAQWRGTQRRIVRLYLRELAVDFLRIHREARAMVARSPEQYADAIPTLFRQQAAFWRALLWIELRLAFAFVPGLRLSRINPEPLLGPLQAILRETHKTASLA